MPDWLPEPNVIDWLLEPDEPAVRALAPRDLVRSKADDQGRWPLEVPAYGKREWIACGRKGAPNKWVTLRALRALKAAGG